MEGKRKLQKGVNYGRHPNQEGNLSIIIIEDFYYAASNEWTWKVLGAGEISKGVLQGGDNHDNLTGCHHTETVSVFISNWALSVLFSTGYLYESRENGEWSRDKKNLSIYFLTQLTHG